MLPRVSAIHLCISTASVLVSLDLAEVGHAQLAVHQALESSLERYVVSVPFRARLREMPATYRQKEAGPNETGTTPQSHTIINIGS